MSARNNRSLLIAALIASPAAGCVDYLSHRDSISSTAGDAVYANRAIQTIDPWPPVASKTTIDSDGRIIKRAIDDYSAPRDKAPPGGAAGGASSSSPGTSGNK